jgi:hypothetical protein
MLRHPDVYRRGSVSAIAAAEPERWLYSKGSSTNTGICRSVFVWYFA